MSDERRDPDTADRLKEEDPLDRIQPDEGDDERVKRAWDDTDVGEGQAPTG